MCIKLFPATAVILKDTSSVLVQRQILNTLWHETLIYWRVTDLITAWGLTCFIPSYRKETLFCLSMDETQSFTYNFSCLVLGKFFHTLDCISVRFKSCFSFISCFLLFLGYVGSSHITIWSLALYLCFMVAGKSVPWKLRVFLKAILTTKGQQEPKYT